MELGLFREIERHVLLIEQLDSIINIISKKESFIKESEDQDTPIGVKLDNENYIYPPPHLTLEFLNKCKAHFSSKKEKIQLAFDKY